MVSTVRLKPRWPGKFMVMNQMVRVDDRGQAGNLATGSGSGSAGHMDRQGQDQSLSSARPRVRGCSSAPKEGVVSLGWELHAAVHGHGLPWSPSCYKHMWEKARFMHAAVKGGKICSGLYFHVRVMGPLFRSVPTNPPLLRTGPKTSTTCVPSAKHFSHPKIRFLDTWKMVSKSHFKHFIYKLDLNISLHSCIEIQPCNLSREWVGRIVLHSFFLKCCSALFVFFLDILEIEGFCSITPRGTLNAVNAWFWVIKCNVKHTQSINLQKHVDHT